MSWSMKVDGTEEYACRKRLPFVEAEDPASGSLKLPELGSAPTSKRKSRGVQLEVLDKIIPLRPIHLIDSRAIEVERQA